MIVKEALGLTFNQTLDSSYGLIETLLQEYSFVMRERNKTTDEDGKVEGRDYEWVELPSFDDPSKTIRIKKYNGQGLSNLLLCLYIRLTVFFIKLV